MFQCLVMGGFWKLCVSLAVITEGFIREGVEKKGQDIAVAAHALAAL